jgi:hypothetical protein
MSHASCRLFSSVREAMVYRNQLRYLGFCGVDDSIDPRLLGLIAHSYPFVEFGVLFRPDKVRPGMQVLPTCVEMVPLTPSVATF